MQKSNFRSRAIIRGLKDPVVTTGRVPIVRAKYSEKTRVYNLVSLNYGNNHPYMCEKVINEMYAERRGWQLDVCNKKYRLGFWDYLRLFWDFLCHRVNKLNVTIAFYVRHDDETRVSTVQSFKSIFEKCGHIVDVKYTEAGWYKFIGRNVPTLAHCLSEVSGNPIVQEGVKIAIFDFDDSLKVAKDAIMFCDTSLGYHSGFYDTVSSASFFRAFYKEIVIGRGVLDTYKRLCRDSLIAPILSEKVSGTRDFVINSNFSRENYD